MEANGVFLSEANASPFEHLGLLGKVGDLEGPVLCKESAIVGVDQVVDLTEKVLALLNPLVSF